MSSLSARQCVNTEINIVCLKKILGASLSKPHTGRCMLYERHVRTYVLMPENLRFGHGKPCAIARKATCSLRGNSRLQYGQR